MSVDWDKRYREGFYDGATEPHELLKRYWPAIPKGRVIDIAMGNGRDALFLAEKGHNVYGFEKSSEAIKIAKGATPDKGYNITIVSGDANALPFKRGSIDGAIVFYFLLRDIMGEIAGLLKQGGILIYETFLKRQNTIDAWRNPEHLLEDGELISYFRELDLLFYEETVSLSEGKKRALARFVGMKK
ncbi:MAG: class I SAM-dependent methyltransferase [Proteobacteria bacterium]|nr:class I SAM-dependent methyltransferase [Pseudomonadota bacterium]